MNFQEATKHIQTVDYSFLQDHEEAVLNKMRKTATPAVLKMVDGFLINYTVYGNKYHTSYVAAMADESGNWADCESKAAIIAFAKQFVVAAEIVKSETNQKLSLTDNEKSFIKMVINYETAEEQRGDNYSNAGMAEAVSLMGSKHAGAGLLGSLTAKGVGVMDKEDYDIFWLNEDKLDDIFNELKGNK